MNEIEEFVRTYDGSQKNAIEFSWNNKHAAEFFDSNQDFRSKVVAFICEDPGRSSIELIRDLFIEESKWSVQAWCAPFTFADLGALLLSRGGPDHLSDFLDGFSASFDTFGACHGMNLDPLIIASLLRSLEQSLSETTEERLRTQLESGKELLEKLKAGNAANGWAVVKPGTPVSNIRVLGRVGLSWHRFKHSIARSLRIR
jgi:hypothetical protein